MEKKSTLVLVASIILSTVFGAASGAITTLMLIDETPYEGAVVVDTNDNAYNYAWEKASPAVVSVVAMKDLSEYYNQFFFFNGAQPQAESGELQQVSSGSAFLVSEDGLAVTNRHVVSDTEAEYVAILSDGTQLEVEVLGLDTLNDIALLQLKGVKDLPYIEFADSDAIEVGDRVLAIGNALGEYANTTTAGIISATGRQIVASSGGNSASNLVNLIQTDAAINPGNSGGPLVDMEGKVVGMNTAIDSSAEGIGFAIGANDIESVVDSYKENGRIVRPYLGVRYILINEGFQEQNNLSVENGAYVLGDSQAGLVGVVKDSPADKADIREGDIILSVEGKEINENFDLSNAISAYKVGDKLLMEILRDDKTIEISVTLEENEATK